MSEEALKSFSIILQGICRKLKDCYDSRRPIPSWLNKQIQAVYLMLEDESRGWVLLRDGLCDEVDFLKSLEDKHFGRLEELRS